MPSKRVPSGVKVCLLVLALLLAIPLVERIRGKWALGRLEKQLQQNGEALTITALTTPALPESDNGVMALNDLLPRLQAGRILPTNTTPLMVFAPSPKRWPHPVPGYRIETWSTSSASIWQPPAHWPETNDWSEVEAELAANQTVLDAIQQLVSEKQFDNRLNYEMGCELTLPHLIPIRNLGHWYVAAGQSALRRKDAVKATQHIVTLLRLTKLLECDRYPLSELLRRKLLEQARAICWEALEADLLSDAELHQIQMHWETVPLMTNLIATLRLQRACNRYEIQKLATPKYSYDIAVTMFHTTPVWTDVFPDAIVSAVLTTVGPAYWRFAWRHQDEHNLLQAQTTLLEICEGTQQHRSRRQIAKTLDLFSDEYRLRECHSTKYPATDIFLNSCFTAVEHTFRSETQRALVLTAIALKRHHLRFGKYPETLSALVPEFLSATPIDWMNGKPLKYRLNTDGSFTLYSVGEDGLDDGGNFAPREDYHGSDLWKRRDYVWPAPATPEEVEEYRRTAATN